MSTATMAPGDHSAAPARSGAKTYAGGTAEAGDRTIMGAGASNDANTHDVVSSSVIDDATMRQLCSMDVSGLNLIQCGLPLMDERLRQSLESAREAAAFIKKQSALEDEYSHGLGKISKSYASEYSSHEARSGTYGASWKMILQAQDALSANHARFSTKLTAISDDIALLVRDSDRQRRQHVDMGHRLEKSLLEAEANVDRARIRFDIAAEDLERVFLVKQGDTARAADMSIGAAANKRTLGMSFTRGGLFKSKNPQQILRHEEEFRIKKNNAHETLRSEAQAAQTVRQEYFQQHLPHILRNLRDTLSELDTGLQYQLMRFAFLYESTVLGDGMTINPLNEKSSTTGLRDSASAIDNTADFQEFLRNYELAHGSQYKGPRRQNPYDETTLSNLMYQTTLSNGRSTAPSSAEDQGAVLGSGSGGGHPIFGVDLTTQLMRDNVEVPPILQICADAIERVGIQNMGIYRLSGTTSRVQKLKAKFDADWSSVDLMNDEALSDINIVAGCLKLWFRELPEPLLTYALYPKFIEAAKVEDDYLRQIRLHEQVNELPDANYATLRFLMAHLDRIRSQEGINQMSAHNLAIVFGPTLLSPPHEVTASAAGAASGGPVQLQDMSHQCLAIETILLKYRDIFVDSDEERE
ncbi:Rho GTPase-activating protein [Malassezia psittaci]|uniref:Rho GTPase-activating protein n=1 Tax=Malassezia psittaci TaxID=1821823 RepID=A0AAF0FBG6_9BASI|nr:Rho GTPase-activating protein [Malassezia psittaci]